MKAIINDRRNSSEHKILGKVVPLHMPFVLVLDPSNLCNHRCKFCPTGNDELIKSTNRWNGIFDFELFKKIINDLKEFDKPLNVLRLYKEGEPLINKQFPEMVKYAKDSGYVKRVDVTSNGVLLNPDLNIKLVESGLDRINISVNGISDDQIKYYTNTKVNFNKYVENIRHLYKNKGNLEIFIKSIKENLSEEEQKKFYDIFGEISDRIFLENISPAWPEFKFDDIPMEFSCGNYGQEIINRTICPYIFYMMVINSDGKVSFCIGDYKHILIAGDTKKQSVKEIWNGNILNNARLEQLNGNIKNMIFCQNCEVITYGTLDNLDPYKEEILKRFKENIYN